MMRYRIAAAIALTALLTFGCNTAAKDDDNAPEEKAAPAADEAKAEPGGDEPTAGEMPAQEPLDGPLDAPDDDPVLDEPMEAGDAAPITVSGALTYTELPNRKSVEAWLGKEFMLVAADGTEHNLKASDKVSRDDLIALSGQTVEVTCVPYPEREPDPMESSPNGMKRPGGCTVTAIATQ